MSGIIGVSSHSNVVVDIYDGLVMLQHRGQDAAGVITFDGRLNLKKGKGLVSEVFNQENIAELQGKIGIGQVISKTSRGLNKTSSHPFITNYPFGITLVYTGNLTNNKELQAKIKNEYKYYLNSESDSEIILGILSHELTFADKQKLSAKEISEAVGRTMSQLEGAYSVIALIANHGLLAFRDPYAIRPIIYGAREIDGKKDYMIATESVALEGAGFSIVNDIQPGQSIFIDTNNKIHIEQSIPAKAKKPCIFEFIYLARPDSMIDDISVYKTRLRMGEKLAVQIQESGLEIDSVIPIPDTSRPIAQALAEKIKKPLREGFIKNRYVGRTFIMDSQTKRQKSVKQKLNPIPLEFKGKNVLLVDDSIVRGTTAKKIIEMAREAGANKVYIASGAPQVKHPDVYGVDLPVRTDLVAHNRSTEEICKLIGADALFFQTLEDLINAAKIKSKSTKEFSTGCFNFGYATPEVTEEYLEKLLQEFHLHKQNILKQKTERIEKILKSFKGNSTN